MVRLLLALLVACGGSVGTVEAPRPETQDAASGGVAPDRQQPAGGDTSRGVPPSLEQRTGGGPPRQR